MELRMAEHAVWCFIFILTLLEVSVKTKMTIHEHTHGKENGKYIFYGILILVNVSNVL
jgi:hypothetical protein